MVASWMVKTFGVEHLSEGSGVLDIAGGRGDLSFALMFTHHVTSSTLIDPVGSTLALLFHHLFNMGLNFRLGASFFPNYFRTHAVNSDPLVT